MRPSACCCKNSISACLKGSWRGERGRRSSSTGPSPFCFLLYLSYDASFVFFQLCVGKVKIPARVCGALRPVGVPETKLLFGCSLALLPHAYIQLSSAQHRTALHCSLCNFVGCCTFYMHVLYLLHMHATYTRACHVSLCSGAPSVSYAAMMSRVVGQGVVGDRAWHVKRGGLLVGGKSDLCAAGFVFRCSARSFFGA